MRYLALLAGICLPSLSVAQDRFDDWVEKELGYAPYFAQSIGWDTPESSVTVADPKMTATGRINFFGTPAETAWVVGILDDAEAAQLTGLALIWSDGFIDRVLSHGFVQTRSQYISFQTPEQLWEGDAFPEPFLTDLSSLAPGPRLVAHPNGTVFPAGDGGVPGICYETLSLYKDDDALIGLVVLFHSTTRTDADVAVCAPLTT